MFKFKRVGGMLHWRIGRIGGSLYLASRNPKPACTKEATRIKRARVRHEAALWRRYGLAVMPTTQRDEIDAQWYSA